MKTRSIRFLLLATVLLTAGLFAACSSDDDAPPVVKTELVAAVTAANALLSSTIEGVAAGNYIKGSQAPLIAAIAQAQAVVDDATAAQTTVTNATVALAAALSSYEAQKVVPIDPANLVGQWTFDELTTAVVGTSVKDYSGNNYNGTIKAGHAHWGGGIPVLAEDRYGIANKALHFDEGSNVEIPYNSSLNPPNISVSLWLKQDVQTAIYADQYMIAMNRWNGYKLQMESLPRPFFTVNPAENPGGHLNRDSGPTTFAQGTWWHVVVTFGGGHMVFYINGVQTEDHEDTGTVISLSGSPVNLVIGQDLPSTGYSLDDTDPNYLNWGGYFVGTLDEIRIYKSVLTASQVTSIYEVEKP